MIHTGVRESDMDEQANAFAQGRKAFDDGLAEKDNPYDLEGENYIDGLRWRHGFRERRAAHNALVPDIDLSAIDHTGD